MVGRSPQKVIWVEMSEDDVVGPCLVREPPIVEPPSSKFMVEYAPGYFATRNGEFFSTNRGSEVKRIKIAVNGAVPAGPYKRLNAAGIMRDHFMPKPMHKKLKHIMRRDGNINNLHVDNLRWSSFKSKKAVRRIAKGIENNVDYLLIHYRGFKGHGVPIDIQA